MLTGIHPLLHGALLAHLDAMGHSDGLVVADAHFPAARVGSRWLEMPGTDAPALVRAIRTVLPLDAGPAVDLMDAGAEALLPVQRDLVRAAGVPEDAVALVSRSDFYTRAASAYLVVRTGETRTFANVLLRKGVVQ